MRVGSLGWEDPLEEEIATHTSILAWEIPWTEEPRGLPSMGSQSWTQLSDSRTVANPCRLSQSTRLQLSLLLKKQPPKHTTLNFPSHSKINRKKRSINIWEITCIR